MRATVSSSADSTMNGQLRSVSLKCCHGRVHYATSSNMHTRRRRRTLPKWQIRGHNAGLAVPCREGPGYRATVSHMGSRHSSATNLVQMQSADMARYMPTTGPALVGDRCAHALPLTITRSQMFHSEKGTN